MKQVSQRPGAGKSRIRARMLGAVILLTLAACTPDEGPSEVRIRIFNSAFIPSEIEVAAGSEVRFVVINEDPIDHELIIGDSAVQLRHERGTDPHHGAIPGEVSVPAGSTATTTYRFGSAGGPPVLLGCHLPGHYAYGMKGTITVR